MLNTKTISYSAIVGILSLSMVACSESQILTDLDLAAAAAAAAVSVAPGLPPAILTYVNLTVNALDCAAAVADKGGTAAEVNLGISQCGLSAVAQTFPPGTPQSVISIINALVGAVGKILSDHQAAVLPTAMAHPPKFKLGFRGHAKLVKIRKSLADSKAKLAPIKK